MSKRFRGRLGPTFAAILSLVATSTFALLIVGPAVPAAASTQVICSKFTDNGKTNNIAVGKCTPKAGHQYAQALGHTDLVGTLTWTGGATTTIGFVSSTPVPFPWTGCPSSDGSGFGLYGEYIHTDVVTAASTAGPGIPAVGDQVSATFCFYVKTQHYGGESRLLLLPGTTISL